MTDTVIDFHTHTFPQSISLKTINALSRSGHVKPFSDGSAEGLAEMMKKSVVDYSVNLPVMTRPEQVTKVNDSLLRQQETLLEKGIITFGGLHPGFEDYREEIRKLKNAGIKGIKLHPAFQGLPIGDMIWKRIIGAISEAGLITLVHCGWDMGFMERNYAPVSEILDVIEDVRPDKLVLAHMGGWQDWENVKQYLAGAPVWLDTAFSLGPVHPREGDEEPVLFRENLTEEQFTALVRRHGADRVLFATDCPWASQRDYIGFVERSPLTDEEKAQIFSENARSLLCLKTEKNNKKEVKP